MLNNEEELRLANCIGVLKHDLTIPQYPDRGLTVEAQLWFAEKLKEVNDELKRLYDTAREIESKIEDGHVLVVTVRCPVCKSSDPRLHPAVQAEGEVQPCPHEWHKR